MNQDSIQKIYDEIGQLQLELEPDPTILGPRYINEITARCRNHLNKVTLIRLRLSREKRALKSRLAGEETLLAAERDRLLAEDETVRRQPNLRDREAVANTILRDRLNTIAQLKNELLDLDTVEKAVTLVHDELIRTGNEIKTQRSLILADRASGAAYGDEYDGPRDNRGRVLPPTSIDEGELDRIMAEDPQPAAVEPAVTPVEAATEATQDSPAEVASEPAVELPDELAALGTTSVVEELVEKLPEPIKAGAKSFVDQAVKTKADPSANLPEDPDVLQFLETDFTSTPTGQVVEKVEPKVESKPVVSTTAPAKMKVDDDEDFLASLLQNI